jgi:hypothetical protein
MFEAPKLPTSQRTIARNDRSSSGFIRERFGRNPMDGDTVRCILLGAVILGGIGLIYILVPDDVECGANDRLALGSGDLRRVTV